MKIVELKAENVKRLRAVHIKPENGELVVIGGKNAAGKSSVLDAIEMALGGKASVPGTPVHRGAEKGRVVVDLGDLIVTRRFTAGGGTSLAVETRGGATKKSPQALLDALVGRLSFDPLAFKTMKPAEQYETLQEVLGLDFDALEERRGEIYSQRTAVNHDVTRLEGELASHEHHPDAPAGEVSVAALSEELEAALETVSDAARDREQVRLLETVIREKGDRLQALEAEAQETREWLSQHGPELERRREIAANSVVRDPDPIRERLATAEDTNHLVRENAARLTTQTRLGEARNQSEELTRGLDAIHHEKQAAIAGAEFPVEGLSLEAGSVLFGDLPFDQASDAEKLRVSVAMAIQMNPKLRVLLIRDGSLLDTESLRLVAGMAAEAEVQVWIERVGTDEATSVVIEDGMVAAQDKE